MKLVQAQIEAAAKEIRIMLATIGNPTPENFAYVALTAAAEAGEQEIVQLEAECIKAAEEIDKIADRVEAEFEEREAATIERCAQVADKKAAEIEAWSYQDTASRLAAEMLRKAAAAIRAETP